MNAMTLSAALMVAIIFFPLSEIGLALFKRARQSTAAVEDRGSLRLLWVTIVLAVAAAVAVQSWRPAPLPGPVRSLRLLALGLMVGGLTLRWASIITLGRFFTVDVATQSRQPVIQTGPYRFVRHPSYTGLLLTFAGLGVYFANWLSLAVLLAPIAAAVMNRIVKEEAVLLAALGPPYSAYCARTKRLLPGIL